MGTLEGAQTIEDAWVREAGRENAGELSQSAQNWRRGLPRIKGRPLGLGPPVPGKASLQLKNEGSRVHLNRARMVTPSERAWLNSARISRPATTPTPSTLKHKFDLKGRCSFDGWMMGSQLNPSV